MVSIHAAADQRFGARDGILRRQIHLGALAEQSECIRRLVEMALEAEGLGSPGHTPYIPNATGDKPKS